ncbi:MAG: alpha-amylase family glycosyl hydrolase [candidate division KSB1 bacterium]|nr:alpha-amylase family glycosyl hydrolase [candidate division KSB1 bacterium]
MKPDFRRGCLLLLFLIPGWAYTQPRVSWEPTFPTPYSTLTIRVTGCTMGGYLHWGVNGWKEPISAYWPPGTFRWGDGAAVESPLQGPDANRVCSITLGPFTDPRQQVSSVDFVIHWSNNSWDNNNGNDYHITLLTRVSWRPLEPSVNDTIWIRVSGCTQGGFLHWGVNGVGRQWERPVSEYWPPGSTLWSDGVAVETPLFGPSAARVCSVAVGPFRSGAQLVEKLDFAFRWADGSWDNNFGQDYHIPVSPEPLSGAVQVRFVSPSSDTVLTGGATIRIEGVRSETLELWIDGRPRAAASGTTLEWWWEAAAEAPGRHRLVAKAQDGAGLVALARVDVWTLPQLVNAEPPPGTRLGATDNGDGTVTFALFAPNTRFFVSLVGDFNGWNPAADVMNRSPDGRWWIVKALAPGTYRYRFVIDGELGLADPYAREVDWTLQGQQDYRPENARSVIRVGAPAYQWHDQQYRRPSWYDYVIYEMHVGDFAGTFEGVRNKLDYLVGLGINAIELMPCYEFPGSNSWGYNPAFYFAPEATYGSPEDLKRLIDEAHQRGIAVFMDMVFNHVDWSSPLVLPYADNLDNSPYFHSAGNDWGMPDFDHTKPATKQLFRDVVEFWIREYHIDGFRFDATRYIEEEGIASFADYARTLDPLVYRIAEHLPQDPTLLSRVPVSAEWHDTFHDVMKTNLRTFDSEGTRRALDYAADGFRDPTNVINYTVSHDEQRTIYECLNYVGTDYATAVAYEKMTGAVLLAAAGVPMLYHGQEYGEDLPKVVGRNPLDWTKPSREPWQGILRYYRGLLSLRKALPALRRGTVSVVRTYSNQRTVVFHRTYGQESVVVAANFSRSPQTVQVPFPVDGQWFEFTRDETLQVAGGVIQLTLSGPETRIFTQRRVWTSVKEGESPTLPTHAELAIPHPNPFHKESVTALRLPAGTVGEVGIYDVLGRKVATLRAGPFPAGTHSLIWDGRLEDGSPAPSGVYVVQFAGSDVVLRQKVLLLR